MNKEKEEENAGWCFLFCLYGYFLARLLPIIIKLLKQLLFINGWLGKI